MTTLNLRPRPGATDPHAPAPPTPALALLTVFYDGSCGLCSAEIAQLRELDADAEMHFIDCSVAGFDDGPWRAEGVTQADMLREMHVRDVLGDWHRGVDAFGVLYSCVGAPALARLWAHPLTRPLTRRLYPWVVAHRHQLSALGLQLIVPRVLQLLAWRSARRVRCEHGACRVPTRDELPPGAAGRAA